VAQDSNLRRHTPTDFQNVDADAVTCGFTTPPPNFGTFSPRLRAPRFHRSAEIRSLLRDSSGANARSPPTDAVTSENPNAPRPVYLGVSLFGPDGPAVANRDRESSNQTPEGDEMSTTSAAPPALWRPTPDDAS